MEAMNGQTSSATTVMLAGGSLDALADRLYRIADELRNGKWPKAGAIIRDNRLEINLEVTSENPLELNIQ